MSGQRQRTFTLSSAGARSATEVNEPALKCQSWQLVPVVQLLMSTA